MSEEARPITDEEITLHKFLGENEKALAVVGVFAALGVIWKTAWQSEEIPLIAYLCFFITIPILWEIRSRYRGLNAHWRLIWFMDAFTAIYLLTIITVLFGWPERLGFAITILAGFFALVFGLKYLVKREKESKAEKYKKYLEQWNAVSDTDPNRNGLRNQLTAEYLRFDWWGELKEIGPGVLLVLWAVTLWLYLPTLSQAAVDYIRQTKIYEIVPVRDVDSKK